MSIELRTEAPGYGCHNRAPYKPSHLMFGIDRDSGGVIGVEVPFRMAHDCQYTLTALGQQDKRCLNCSWRKEVDRGL